MEGRINIHLHEHKEKLQTLHPGYGELSKIVRVLIESYVEGRIMHLSPKIAELLDQGKDEEAIQLLTNDLLSLRQRRVQAGTKATKQRNTSKTQKAKDQAGIKSPEKQLAEKMVEDMLKMTQDTNTIEFTEGGEDGLQGANRDKEATTTFGAAKKVR